MKKLFKIVLVGLLLSLAAVFVGCKSNIEPKDVTSEAVECNSERNIYTGKGGFGM